MAYVSELLFFVLVDLCGGDVVPCASKVQCRFHNASTVCAQNPAKLFAICAQRIMWRSNCFILRSLRNLETGTAMFSCELRHLMTHPLCEVCEVLRYTLCSCNSFISEKSLEGLLECQYSDNVRVDMMIGSKHFSQLPIILLKTATRL